MRIFLLFPKQNYFCSILLFALHLYWLYCYTLLYQDFRTYENLYPKTSGAIWKQEYEYLIEPCVKNVSQISLVILVTTRPESYERRQIIRKTWGGHFQKYSHCRVVFIFGRNGAPSTLGDDIFNEVDQYGDVLYANFEDTYYNLSLKSYIALNYAIKSFPRSKLILKTDDDVVLFTENILKYVDEVDNSRKTFFCYQYIKSMVKRNGNDRKSYLPYLVYSKRYFPPFCSGHAYIGTRLAIDDIVNYVRNDLNYYLHLEDVLLTGLIAEECKIERVHSFGWHPLSSRISNLQSDLSIHYLKDNKKIFDMWRRYQNFLKA